MKRCSLPVLGLVPGTAVAAYFDAGGGLGLFEAVILIFTGLLVLLVWLHLRSEKPQPFGYLYRLKGKRIEKFTISSEVCRIGRHPNNELRLNHKSISRFHAELVRNHNGTFSIYDTDSKNGIRVGMRPVNSSVLREGDLIDVGDIRLKFTRRPRDYNVQANTIMLDHAANRYDTRRRREVRANLSTQVRLYNDETGWVNGWMRNVGRDGSFIETDVKLATRLPVDIVVAVEEDQKRKWLHLTGEVAWSDAKGVGISFTDRGPGTLDQLLSTAA
ncbi:MAG: FHA domain-containing protein [Gammaproteobacteria bacterium]|nr:FHA domain-containing protein [Gammaproteobacteria bacterium]